MPAEPWATSATGRVGLEGSIDGIDVVLERDHSRWIGRPACRAGVERPRSRIFKHLQSALRRKYACVFFSYDRSERLVDRSERLVDCSERLDNCSPAVGRLLRAVRRPLRAVGRLLRAVGRPLRAVRRLLPSGSTTAPEQFDDCSERFNDRSRAVRRPLRAVGRPQWGSAYPPKAIVQYAFSCFSPWISVMKRIFRSSISDQFSM
jgi:hypothetical protein